MKWWRNKFRSNKLKGMDKFQNLWRLSLRDKLHHWHLYIVLLKTMIWIVLVELLNLLMLFYISWKWRTFKFVDILHTFYLMHCWKWRTSEEDIINGEDVCLSSLTFLCMNWMVKLWHGPSFCRKTSEGCNEN